jgi:hypothetical protein
VFNPQKHKSVQPGGAPFVNKYGYFMPIGGQSASAVRRTAAAVAAAQAVPLEAAAWSPEEQANGAGVPYEEPGGQDARPGTPPGAPGVQPMPENDPGANDAAEVATRALYFAVGSIFGSLEEATPTALEHQNFKDGAAAYFRSVGWRSTALTCIILRCLAYVLTVAHKPAASAKIKEWIAEYKAKKKAAPKPVEPTANEPSRQATPANAAIVSNGAPRYSERAA